MVLAAGRQFQISLNAQKKKNRKNHFIIYRPFHRYALSLNRYNVLFIGVSSNGDVNANVKIWIGNRAHGKSYALTNFVHQNQISLATKLMVEFFLFPSVEQRSIISINFDMIVEHMNWANILFSFYRCCYLTDFIIFLSVTLSHNKNQYLPLYSCQNSCVGRKFTVSMESWHIRFHIFCVSAMKTIQFIFRNDKKKPTKLTEIRNCENIKMSIFLFWTFSVQSFCWRRHNWARLLKRFIQWKYDEE